MSQRKRCNMYTFYPSSPKEWQIPHDQLSTQSIRQTYLLHLPPSQISNFSPTNSSLNFQSLSAPSSSSAQGATISGSFVN